jgi:alpha,alpha-trehalase
MELRALTATGSDTEVPWAAVIFDLDGVVTDTAAAHARAWKEMFDAYLAARQRREGEYRAPFDIEEDYRRHVDGKPRYDGVRDFLASRDISIPYGAPDDPADKETVCGLGNRKNQLFQDILRQEGVTVHDAVVRCIHRLRAAGAGTAVVSSSKNCATVLETAGIENLFDVRVDGILSENLHLAGKPAPDIFLTAAERLGVDPGRTAVVEDALAGVEAGRRGGFGLVVGLDRLGRAPQLRARGADRVAADGKELQRILIPGRQSTDDLPSALGRWTDMARRLSGKKPVVFLDYDGTLTPIVDRPEQAVLSPEMGATLARLAGRCTVAVISGRDLKDVKSRVGLESLYYAGSHGFDIAGPQQERIQNEKGLEALPKLDSAEGRLRGMLRGVDGAEVERKKFSIAVHYRRVAAGEQGAVEGAVDAVVREHGGLRKGTGKKVFEVQPDIAWDKGKALGWLLETLGLQDSPGVLPIYIGDDVTDEDAFKVLAAKGIGIVVHAGDAKRTHARYVLADPSQVGRFLEKLVSALEAGQ